MPRRHFCSRFFNESDMILGVRGRYSTFTRQNTTNQEIEELAAVVSVWSATGVQAVSGDRFSSMSFDHASDHASRFRGPCRTAPLWTYRGVGFA
jgi:hypothetical protein